MFASFKSAEDRRGMLILPAGCFERGWRTDDKASSATMRLTYAQLGQGTLNVVPLYEGIQIDENVELMLGAGCHRFAYPMRQIETRIRSEVLP
ncbi:MAG: hypothetical protein KF726_03940 [Anaerolineae bacterium]|nr:hypothetical protein [Anaerolineae bacterium]